MEQHNRIFQREGSFVQFNQYGLKLNISNDITDVEYYRWLDEMIASLGKRVPGGTIVEKDDARTKPRYNAGVYYDTADLAAGVRPYPCSPSHVSAGPATHPS